MQSKLVKAWGPYTAGTIVVDNKEAAAGTPGALRVNPARFAALTESGHLAAAELDRPIPAEVKTSRGPFKGTPHTMERESVERDLPSLPIAAPTFDKGGHNDAPPTTPRPDSSPVGQGGKAKAEEP